MSDAPRTDERVILMLSPLQSGTMEVVHADLARQLEQELTAARKEIEKLWILLGGIHETYATELSPQCNAAIDAAFKERGEK